jgi:hypothetical protein
MEGSDLTTAIGKKLEGTNRTRPDLVDVLGGFCLAENFRTSQISKITPEGSFANQKV